MATSISDIIGAKTTAVTKADMQGVKKIRKYAFPSQTSLREIYIPSSVLSIGDYAFDNCTNIETITFADDISPYMYIGSGGFIESDHTVYFESMQLFSGTKWAANQPSDSLICIAQGRILLANTISDTSSAFTIPETVVTLASRSCGAMGGSSTLTEFVIPDTVEMIQDFILSSHTNINKITIGSSVRYIGAGLANYSSSYTLIFRQPAGMYVELPPEGGDGKGIAYNKSSRSCSIYTDNEYIMNYDWATDNVTPTFYPLSEAPV